MAVAALLVAAAVACGSAGAPVRSPTERAGDSAPAVAALVASRFDEAGSLASVAMARDGGNARAAAVRAIAAYQAAGSRLRDELFATLDKDGLRHLDHEAGRAAWQHFADSLAVIDRDLAVVAADPAFSLELCLACWEHDWNHSGEIDDRDRRLLEIEVDGRTGAPLPEGDPRRRPTFRFDAGDAEWALAMVAFQRAAVELVLSYRWSELERLVLLGRGLERFVLPLGDPSRVTRARELVLAGLDHAERCRAAYLAETDDDREWVPSPRQRNYPMPLELDAALYETWSLALGDARRLLRSEEGLSLREIGALIDDDLAVLLPEAYIDLGAMLREPREISVVAEQVVALDRVGPEPTKTRPLIEQLLRGIFGKGYATKMKPSPLLSRFARMKRELEDGSDTFERKLRYLLWLN